MSKLPLIYFLRILARLIDLSLAVAFSLAVEKAVGIERIDWFLVYLLYLMVVALSGGNSLGKHCFSLQILTQSWGMKARLMLCLRELLFFLLFPFVLVNLMALSRQPWHDAITGCEVKESHA